MKLYIFLTLAIFVTIPAMAGPIIPTRGFLIAPAWSSQTDTTSILGHGSYWAQVQRGLKSDSERWAWEITMGAIFEIARWNGNRSLFAFTGMELTADLNDAIDFRPRGAFWHEGLVYAAHENPAFDWQLGLIYTCRHDIDNGDPGQYSNVGGERTLIYGSLSGKAIWKSDKLFGLYIPTTAWLHGDAYLVGEDYRLPRTDAFRGTDFQEIAWSVGPAFQSRLVQWKQSSVYFELNTDFTAFGNDTGFFSRFRSISTLTFDDHAELGFEFHGAASRMQLYAGWEQWQDDGETPIPRNARYALLGIRVTGIDMMAF